MLRTLYYLHHFLRGQERNKFPWNFVDFVCQNALTNLYIHMNIYM